MLFWLSLNSSKYRVGRLLQLHGFQRQPQLWTSHRNIVYPWSHHLWDFTRQLVFLHLSGCRFLHGTALGLNYGARSISNLMRLSFISTEYPYIVIEHLSHGLTLWPMDCSIPAFHLQEWSPWELVSTPSPGLVMPSVHPILTPPSPSSAALWSFLEIDCETIITVN